jgi:hypothetical protein
MAAYRLGLRCCGIAELAEIRTSLDARSMIASLQRSVQPFIIFSDVLPYIHAQKLIAYIDAHSLGPVMSPTARINGNSGNRLKVWVWSPNRAALNRLRKQPHKDTP